MGCYALSRDQLVSLSLRFKNSFTRTILDIEYVTSSKNSYTALLTITAKLTAHRFIFGLKRPKRAEVLLDMTWND